MDDRQIIELFFQRSEDAVAEAQKKYGAVLKSVAFNILRDPESAKECENDALLRAWDAIPPAKPENLRAYLARVARNLALSRAKEQSAAKRGGGERELVLEEIADFTPAKDADPTDAIVLRDAINEFLRAQRDERRTMFVLRYWYVCSVKEIASRLGTGESRVKMTLLRMRRELKNLLESKGIVL